MNPWTSSEIAYLRKHAGDGAAAIAGALGRSVASVRAQAQRLRISLRRPGNRGGRVLGQPAGVKLRRALREDLASGTIDATVLAQRLTLDRERALCPACATRPIRVASTGMCRVCHLRELADRHREALAEIDARRDLWQSRQAAKRARDLELAETGGAGYGAA